MVRGPKEMKKGIREMKNIVRSLPFVTIIVNKAPISLQ
jgi:hypothetical protein